MIPECLISLWAFCNLAGALVALVFILTTVYDFFKNVFVFFLAEPLGLTVKFTQLGRWAGNRVLISVTLFVLMPFRCLTVVTGATDGIGIVYFCD